MKDFTHDRLASALVSLLLFFIAGVAHASDFGPAPTKFVTENLNGTYEVTFVGCQSDNLIVDLVNLTDYELVDANGVKVPYTFVVPTMKDEYTVALTVGGADNAPAGIYTIKVPVAGFCLSWMTNVTSDAFDVTLEYNVGGTVDPGTGEVDPDPSTEDGVVTFTLDDHKSDTSLYFHDGDIIEGSGAGVMLKFGRVGVDYDVYTTCYRSNGGFVQFKDCEFTISVPQGTFIDKVVFEDGAPQSTMYDLDNLEAAGYDDGVWTGHAQSVTFKTKVIRSEIYDEDEDGNEYVTGYAEYVTGARVSKIYVKLSGTLDGVGVIAPSVESTVVYDLNGRRAAGNAGGVFISNGKKVIR